MESTNENFSDCSGGKTWLVLWDRIKESKLKFRQFFASVLTALYALVVTIVAAVFELSPTWKEDTWIAQTVSFCIFELICWKVRPYKGIETAETMFPRTKQINCPWSHNDSYKTIFYKRIQLVLFYNST